MHAHWKKQLVFAVGYFRAISCDQLRSGQPLPARPPPVFELLGYYRTKIAITIAFDAALTYCKPYSLQTIRVLRLPIVLATQTRKIAELCLNPKRLSDFACPQRYLFIRFISFIRWQLIWQPFPLLQHTYEYKILVLFQLNTSKYQD